MPWNYRVKKTLIDAAEMHAEKDVYLYTICEAYYGKDGLLESNTLNDIVPWSDDLDGLRWVLQKMLEACDKPVLEEKGQDLTALGDQP